MEDGLDADQDPNLRGFAKDWSDSATLLYRYMCCRDLLMHDFMTVETVQFPKGGGQTTPGHSFSDFTFRSVKEYGLTGWFLLV